MGKQGKAITPDINLVRRVPPHDLEAECAVLGAIILKPEVLDDVAGLIGKGDFYSSAHQDVFQALTSLSASGKAIDLLTLRDQLDKDGTLGTVGGAVYLAELASSTPAASNAAVHARIVRDKSIRRRLLDTGSSLMRLASEPAHGPDELLDAATAHLSQAADLASTSRILTSADLCRESLDRMNERIQCGELVTGVPTGYGDLDALLGGLNPGNLVILAGRPGMGKTGLGLNMAMRSALHHGRPAAFFSLEMTAREIMDRALCSLAHVNTARFRTGSLDAGELDRIYAAADDMAEAPLFIEDTPALRPLELRAKCRLLARTRGLAAVFVDYLQLMRPNQRQDSREREISEISGSLKALAKELRVPVVALSQLNRKVEERANKRPKLSDLRESGSLEQDADAVIFLYNDAYYNAKGSHRQASVTEVILAKHRNGPTGTVLLTFLAEFVAFENHTPENAK